MIGEGLETCLAARQLGLHPVWALGSAGAIEKFSPVDGVSYLIVLGENDDNDTNRNAAKACRENWKGRRVSIIKPRGHKDMNDLLMKRYQNAETATGVTIERC